TVAGKLVLDSTDQLDDMGIVEIPGVGGYSIVEGAARRFDHLAPPTDGAGNGPLMSDNFSLLPPGWSVGAFFKRSVSIVSCPTLRSSAAIFASYSEMVVAAASSTSSSPRSYCSNHIWIRFAEIRVGSLRIASANLAVANVCAQLHLELRTMPTVRSSC